MTALKKLVNAANMKILGAAAALISLTAAASATSLCAYWFHQPKMPDSVRNMRK